ncbi:MAG: LIC12162 family protein [Caldisericia bacterium]|nr:LIC12162 family protein [Caldisericia bacterium]
MDTRFLITTADERTWRTDRPILFLGEWCKLYDRRHVWSNLDAKVVPYHWDDRKKLYQDCLYLNELYEQLLSELGIVLNRFHDVDNSSRYWRILVGPWLSYFIQVVFDRWTMIQRAVKMFDISGTAVLEFPWLKTIPINLSHFDSLAWTDVGNHIIYSRILQGWTDVHCERIPFVAPLNIMQPPAVSFPLSLRQRINLLAQYGLTSLSAPFRRQTDAFLIGTYLSWKLNFRLQMSLGQIPQLWSRMPPLPKVEANQHVREQFKIKSKGIFGFEQCLRSLIPEQIPTIYLEGYQKLLTTVASLPWPKKPKVIFTSNNHNSDDIFKAWTAEKVESGTPLVIGQHGGHYGSGLWSFMEKHETSIADRYLTWGWGEGESKFLPTGALKILSRHPGARDKDGYMLVVMMAPPRYSYTPGSRVISAGQGETYLNDVYRFIDCLENIPRKEILIRPYIHDSGWSQVNRWRDRYPDIRIDSGAYPINRLISKSRLYVSTYNATTFLESLGRNIPTIIFWNTEHWELRSSAVPYFDRLKKVGIFHETPESAAKKASEIWDDVERWWNQSEIQRARQFFCDHFARTVDNPSQVLKKALTLSK